MKVLREKIASIIYKEQSLLMICLCLMAQMRPGPIAVSLGSDVTVAIQDPPTPFCDAASSMASKTSTTWLLRKTAFFPTSPRFPPQI